MHKRDIVRIISKNSALGNGITIMQIVKETKAIVPKPPGDQLGLSRQTVTTFVNKLIMEGKIIKYRNKYFIVDDIVDDGRLEFARYLDHLLFMRFIPDLGLDSIPSFRKMGRSTNNNNAEYALFQTTNRIGAFITYILIEAMSPTGKIISRNMRIKAGLDFIDNAISLPELFGAFLAILPKEYSTNIVKGMELKKASYNKLSNTFTKVYPAVHRGIEDEYSSYFDAFYLDSDRYPNSCKHEWKEKSVYKLGKYYKCPKMC